jgi:hypothetical protein
MGADLGSVRVMSTATARPIRFYMRTARQLISASPS